jgi:hypothetical protein
MRQSYQGHGVHHRSALEGGLIIVGGGMVSLLFVMNLIMFRVMSVNDHIITECNTLLWYIQFDIISYGIGGAIGMIAALRWIGVCRTNQQRFSPSYLSSSLDTPSPYQRLTNTLQQLPSLLTIIVV